MFIYLIKMSVGKIHHRHPGTLFYVFYFISSSRCPRLEVNSFKVYVDDEFFSDLFFFGGYLCQGRFVFGFIRLSVSRTK